jgi:hypothetical protein
MKKVIVGFMLLSGLSVAQANTLSISGATNIPPISGYDSISATGPVTSGVWGTLTSDAPGGISFTYLGDESGYDNSVLAFGGSALTEANPIGTAISGSTDAGTVGFSFKDSTNATFANGATSTSVIGYAFLKDGLGNFLHYATYGDIEHYFDYILGFNDSASVDADYDDYVVGVNAVNAVPLPAAAWLFGSALFGFVSLSRRRNV